MFMLGTSMMLPDGPLPNLQATTVLLTDRVQAMTETDFQTIAVKWPVTPVFPFWQWASPQSLISLYQASQAFFAVMPGPLLRQPHARFSPDGPPWAGVSL